MRRLPADKYDQHVYRVIRAFQLEITKRYLPENEWITYEEVNLISLNSKLINYSFQGSRKGSLFGAIYRRSPQREKRKRRLDQFSLKRLRCKF